MVGVLMSNFVNLSYPEIYDGVYSSTYTTFYLKIYIKTFKKIQYMYYYY